MALPQAALRVQAVLDVKDLGLKVIEMPDSTRTAAEAAVACGCQVAQIAKSLLFRTRETACPILVIASGTNRVHERRVGTIVGEKIERGDADYVRAKTGFAIGGVPPIAHAQAIATFLDQDLWRFDTIWAAAGTPHTVFQATPDVLVALTGALIIEVS